MSLFDALASAANNGDEGAKGNGLIDAAVNFVNEQPGGLNGLVQKFHDAGVGGIVDSWIGTGENQPIDPATLTNVLGEDMVNGLAAKVGVPAPQLMSVLAMMLPGVVDRATPDGALPADGKLQSDSLLSALGGLMGMFGGGKKAE